MLLVLLIPISLSGIPLQRNGRIVCISLYTGDGDIYTMLYIVPCKTL